MTHNAWLWWLWRVLNPLDNVLGAASLLFRDLLSAICLRWSVYSCDLHKGEHAIVDRCVLAAPGSSGHDAPCVRRSRHGRRFMTLLSYGLKFWPQGIAGSYRHFRRRWSELIQPPRPWRLNWELNPCGKHQREKFVCFWCSAGLTYPEAASQFGCGWHVPSIRLRAIAELWRSDRV